MAPISVAFDMTFANRNRGGSGAYARSLVDALREQGEIVPRVISGPQRSNFPATMRWLVRGAHDTLAADPPALLHCPSFVTPWAIKVPVVVTVHDAASKRFPADHPLEWRVRWLGQAPAEEMPALFARASALVYPSLYEGFGFPPLEAMAVGTPVVASNRGSLPEVLGDAALLVDPCDEEALAEAIRAAAQDTGDLRRRGLARAARFTWQRAAEETWRVYEEAARLA